MTQQLVQLGNDVHTYTQYFKPFLPVIRQYLGTVTPENFMSVVHGLNTYCTNRDCSCHIALNNLFAQYQLQHCIIDPHLENLDIAPLLVQCWEYANENDELERLHESLKETGGTCTQGQSHRLLFLFMAYNQLY